MSDMIVEIRGPQGPMRGEVINYKTDTEEWNVYKLEDGSTLRVKLVVSQIAKGLTEDGDTYYQENGEPFYHIKFATHTVADVPEFLMRKVDS